MLLLTKIRVGFSDLRDHRYNYNFNCDNPICSCGIEDETHVHYFLCYPLFSTKRTTPISKISNIIESDVTVFPMEHLYQILVYGSSVFNDVSNKLTISETIKYIKLLGRLKKVESILNESNFIK